VGPKQLHSGIVSESPNTDRAMKGYGIHASCSDTVRLPIHPMQGRDAVYLPHPSLAPLDMRTQGRRRLNGPLLLFCFILTVKERQGDTSIPLQVHALLFRFPYFQLSVTTLFITGGQARTSTDTLSASHLRMAACTSCTCSGVATLPVPMAHTGSYAITTWLPAGGEAHASAVAVEDTEMGN
jgi:hypothetical protein